MRKAGEARLSPGEGAATMSIDSESHSATFLKKSTFIKIYLSRCFPVAPVLITKDEPKKNQRTTKELQNSKKYIY